MKFHVCDLDLDPITFIIYANLTCILSRCTSGPKWSSYRSMRTKGIVLQTRMHIHANRCDQKHYAADSLV